MEGSDIKLPLIEKGSSSTPSAQWTWLADATDLFVLWCSFLLTTTSIVLVALVFHAQATANPNWPATPSKIVSFLQRVIAALSVTITSAVIMVAGKRYVLFKLARGGIRSQRVAVYSNPTIGNLASYMVLRGAELPLFGLSAVWGLALVTGLTVNDSWEMGSYSTIEDISVPFGPLDQPTSSSNSWVVPAIEQLTFVMSSWCLGLADTVGLINITSTNIAADPSHQMGSIYYPPLPSTNQIIDYSFSTTTTMNGVNISVNPLSSIPSTAQNLSTCVQNAFTTGELWFDGSDNQTLSIVVVDKPEFNSTFRIDATAIIMGGTLSSFGNYTEFALNGTSWPNVMSTGNRWAEDIMSIICNTTIPPFMGTCAMSMGSLSDFAALINSETSLANGDGNYGHWSTVLNMALGAYSSAMFSTGNLSGLVIPNAPMIAVPATWYGVLFTSIYGTYILLLNIVVSLAMLVIVVRLRLASHLGPDFINSTRLLLDPLKKPELFNASLQSTVDALADPYMLVGDNNFLLVEPKTIKERKKRFTLQRRNEPIELGDDTTDGM